MTARPDPSPARQHRFRRGRSSFATAFGAGLAFVLLTWLVAAGRFSSIDRYAYAHLVPFGPDPGHESTSLLEKLLAYRLNQFDVGGLIRIPASFLLSSVLIAVICGVLWRRGRRVTSLLLLGVLFCANLGEVLGKLTIMRPDIYVVRAGVPTSIGLHHSFPSGHAGRAVVLAAAATFVWPRFWPLFASWVVAVVVTAEVDGIHTLSDLLGGLLFGLTLILVMLAVRPKFEPSSEAAQGKGRRAMDTRTGEVSGLGPKTVTTGRACDTAAATHLRNTAGKG